MIKRIIIYYSRFEDGYSLLEVLVSVMVLAVVAAVGSNAFFSFLKGSTQTRIILEVKQNGNYAVGMMERLVQNAKEVSGGGNSLTVVDLKGGTTNLVCADLFGTDGLMEIASNSTRLTSNQVKVDDCNQIFQLTAGVAGVRPAEITIDFTLSQAAVSGRLEEQAAIRFKTAVSPRNY